MSLEKESMQAKFKHDRKELQKIIKDLQDNLQTKTTLANFQEKTLQTQSQSLHETTS